MVVHDVTTVAPAVHILGPVHARVSGGDSGIVTGVVAALAGVVVAGLLNLLVNGWGDRRHTAQRIRAGAQLLSTDLIKKSMGLIALEAQQVWEPQLPPMLSDLETWNQARADIAYADWEVYGAVSTLYVGVESLAQRAQLRATGTQFNAEDLKLIRSTKNRAFEAIALLGVFKDPPSALRQPRKHRKWKKDRADARRRAREQRESEGGLTTGLG